MATVTINGDTSGSVSLTVPAVAGTNTATIPASTGNVLLDSTVGVCRAWVNFNGTGTVAIRASFNVSSITDNGTGDYTVNFTTALPDANYNTVFGVKQEGTGGASGANWGAVIKAGTTPTTTALVVATGIPSAGTFNDTSVVNVSVFR